MSAMAQLVDKLEQKLGLEITAIGTRLEGMEEKVELTSTTLNCKVDFLTSKLEEAMDSVVKTVTTQSKPESRDLQLLGEVQQRLEHKVDLLRTNIDEPVALAVHDVLQQDKAEELEIEKRKTNVIIHGLAESQDDSSDQRISDDLAVLSAMFHEAGVENAKVENVVRLGRRPSDPTQNPRPMKVVLDSVDSKITLLKKAKNLRENQEGGWCRIVIHQDLTPKQREARKPLVAELKQRKAQGEQDLVIFNGKVVKKRGSRSSQAN